MNNYDRFINYVLDISAKIAHLALLVAGHPKLGVTFIDLLKKRVDQSIKIQVIDGISSFDVMTTFLDIDPLEQGTSLIDANRLLLFQYKLEPALSYFIYHVSSVGNSKTSFINPFLENRLDLLKDYLLQYYPKDKEIFICRISNRKNESSTKINLSISDLDLFSEKIDYSTTLFLPAEKPAHIDWNYLNLLRKL